MSATLPEIYLDAAATTPPLPAVIDAVTTVQRMAWGNPSSLHRCGQSAAEVLERSRLAIAALLGADRDDVIVTSGATESIHLALLGSAACLMRGRLVISAVEHPAVSAAAKRLELMGWECVHWPVDHQGVIRLDRLEELLAPPTRMVSLIWGQSEVGALEPVIRVGDACRERGIRFHTDATQLIPQGRIQWSGLPIDLLSLSAHKLQGPRGVGLLLKHRDVEIRSLQGGGGQEQGLRSGTEPVALVAGLAAALQQVPCFDALSVNCPPGANPDLRPWRDHLLKDLLSIPGVQLCGPESGERLPHHISLLLNDRQGRPLSGRAVVRELARSGVCVSSGSACSSGLTTDSPVLTAMGVNQDLRRSGLRLSLGPWLNKEELIRVPRLMEQAMQLAGLGD